MSRGTYMIAQFQPIKSNGELIRAFEKYVDCLENPYIERVEFRRKGEMYGLKLEHEKKDHIGYTKKEMMDFLNRTLKENLNTEFEAIDCYGTSLLNAQKYSFPYDTIVLNRNDLAWVGLSPPHYGISADGFSGVAYREGNSEKRLSNGEVGKMITDLSKRIIETFNVTSYAFFGEADYISGSKILYYKDPFLFCLDFEQLNFIIDEKAMQKVAEIKKILTPNELENIIRKHAEEGGYEIYRPPQGGIGIFERWEGKSVWGSSGMLADLRKTVRDRGIELPKAETGIDPMAEMYFQKTQENKPRK